MVKKAGFLFFVFVLGAIILSNPVSAQQEEFTFIIANSDNWEDVFSTVHYANLQRIESDFLVSPRHGPVLLNGISKQNNVQVVSSRISPFAINYDDAIQDREFNGAEEITIENANLELIEELPEIKNFVVVSDTYGYNAVAVTPYAVINEAWVFLADRANIDEIDSILSSRDVDNLLIYGFVERDIRDTLEKYNPEIIDTGDRFQDNIEIVEKYSEIKPSKQVVLSNGEFIEKQVMSGTEPVLFTGKANVPDQIREYIKTSDIEVGVLVGADLVNAATNIRRETGISVIVKFARGARNPTGAVAAVEGLDLFYIPVPIMELDIHSAKFNRATSQLELTYRSDSNIPVYFRGTITPETDSGEELSRIGDIDAIFIAPNDFKTISYSDLNFPEEGVTLDIFTIFGDTASSLERILEKRIEVEFVNVIDSCEVDIEGIKYNKQKDSFFVEIKNIGDVDCWVDVELSDVVIDNNEVTLGSEGSVRINEGRSKNIQVEQELTDEDLESNSFIDVIAYHGEREDSLIRITQGRFELKIEILSFATIGLGLLVLIVLIALVALLILFFRRRKEKEEDW